MSFLEGKVGKEKLSDLLPCLSILLPTSQDIFLLKHPLNKHISKKKEDKSLSPFNSGKTQNS